MSGRRALLVRLAASPDPGWMCWSCRTVNPPGQSSCRKKGCYGAAPEPADIATRLLEGKPAPQTVHRRSSLLTVRTTETRVQAVGAQEWLREQQAAGDQTGTIDRLFLLRYHDSLLDTPRRPAIAAALGHGQARREGTWYLIRADHSFDALATCDSSSPTCPATPTMGTARHGRVQIVTSGELRQHRQTIRASLGADVTPRPVPDVKVAMSHMPRCNRILGNGLWEIPAIPANTEVEER